MSKRVALKQGNDQLKKGKWMQVRESCKHQSFLAVEVNNPLGSVLLNVDLARALVIDILKH